MSPNSPKSNRSLRSEVVSLAWPALLQGLLSTVILFTDRLILGSYHDDALASMQVCGPVLWSIFSLFGAYGAAVLAIIGRSIGAQDYPKAAQTLGSSLLIAGIIGTVIAFAGYFGTDLITMVMMDTKNENASVAELANTYMGITILSAPIFMLGSVMVVALQASGDTKTPMWITGCAGIINLVVSWLLVFGIAGLPKLGIVGAAIGTISSTVSQALLCFLMIRTQNKNLSIQAPSLKRIKQIFIIAWPSFGEKILFHTGFLIFAAYIGRLGKIEMTTHQAMMAIESLGYIGANAFGIAAGTLISQKLGQKNPEEAEKAVRLTLRLGVITLSIIGVFFVLFSHSLISLFSTNPQVLSLGVMCMYIAGISQPIMAITEVFSGALRGAGDTKTPMYIAMVGPLLVRPVFCYVLCFPMGLGLFGIWLGSTADWLIRSFWLYLGFRRGKWKEIEM